ncbi:hypothetical protein [Capnocytophaga felis]|uniref:Uncharacterized protein n=1 Tax=Capnocytophaga felis TaxID=2267611 RepID=A0A5M4BA52_9FLAO|nr:hypothetical protein [Capnocytophaga felis]GET46300.1 hypothetical protein RCZ01_16020 [Capnocytophaga felis]GET48130.1 hypothetical protein RCZ02_09610 [Capnocytophaga felis]
MQHKSDNPKPIKQPKPTKKKEPYFQEGNVLAIEMPQGYGIYFVSQVYQTPRKLEYHLACTQHLSDSVLSPAHNLEDMYDKITEEPRHYGGKTQYIYNMITDIIN